MLERSIRQWSKTLDNLIVVTTPEDSRTGALCDMFGVRCLRTEAFMKDGADFNKAAAMDAGLAMLGKRDDDWILFFDSDIVCDPAWRAHVDAIGLKPGYIYGARRENERGTMITDNEVGGWFQLWHSGDAVAQDRPLLGSWRNASGYDTEFQNRWPKGRRVILPLIFTHLGEHTTHWCGRGRADLMQKMWLERRRRGHTWQHERIA